MKQENIMPPKPIVNILYRDEDDSKVHLVDKSGLVLCECRIFPSMVTLMEKATLTPRGVDCLCPQSKPIYAALVELATCHL
jgi:hypothetical protein